MNKYILEQLQAGKTIFGYKEGGNSMTPIIASRQPVDMAPIKDYSALKTGDIVLAKVKGKWYTHLIHAIKIDEALIGNNHGHNNGWAKHHNIFGIVIAIDGVKRKNSQYK